MGMMPGGTKGRALIVLILAASSVFALGVTPASAHSGEEAYVYMEVFDDSMEGRVEYPVSDLADVLDLEIPDDPEGAEAAIEANLDTILDYTGMHFALSQDGAEWDVEFRADFELLTPAAGTYGVFRFDVDEEFDEMPRTFIVEFDGIVEAKPERSALFLVATDWRSGTFNNEANHLLVFTAENSRHVVDLGETSVSKAVLGVVGLGVEHIQIGSDHILFILALLLPSVLVFYPSLGWRPVESFGAGLWRILKIATSFTIAHTITLTLGGLGVVSISPGIVEPVIAISIALAALHNVRPVFYNKEWILAFAFGLFHGFGFAGLLADLGLDRSNRVLSLLGFNLGIELGQVAIILMLFPALFLLRRTLMYVRLMQVGSTGLIVIALGWFIDRVFGLDFGVDRIVDPILAWPRALWLVAGFTLLAWGYYAFDRSRGRLIPVDATIDAGEASAQAKTRVRE